jgi:hypothetical protein
MIKALTICQPYASLIADGAKRIENRSWYTRYRGWLAIHAGKSKGYMRGEPIPHGMPFGAVVAVAYLSHVFRATEDNLLRCRDLGPAYANHAEGPFCWLLSEVTALQEPLPMRGKRGLYDPVSDVSAFLRRVISMKHVDVAQGRRRTCNTPF